MPLLLESISFHGFSVTDWKFPWKIFPIFFLLVRKSMFVMTFAKSLSNGGCQTFARYGYNAFFLIIYLYDKWEIDTLRE